MLLLVLILKKHGEGMTRRLVLEQEELVQRRATLTAAMQGDDVKEGEKGTSKEDEEKPARPRLRRVSTMVEVRTFLPRLNLRLRAYAVDAARGMVKACETGEYVGETGRIVIGFCQVMHHLPVGVLQSTSSD